MIFGVKAMKIDEKTRKIHWNFDVSSRLAALDGLQIGTRAHLVLEHILVDAIARIGAEVVVLYVSKPKDTRCL